MTLKIWAIWFIGWMGGIIAGNIDSMFYIFIICLISYIIAYVIFNVEDRL